MQLGLMMLLLTHGRPEESSIGCPVTELFGFFSFVLSEEKSPARCGSVGTRATAEPDCGRFHSFW